MNIPESVVTKVVAVAEAAQMLGVSRDTVRRLIADGDLPAFRCGRGRRKGHVRIRLDAITDFIERREREGV
jgi:excisionase family DNA binding protein